jgi:sugar lactone lactonase YvrE
MRLTLLHVTFGLLPILAGCGSDAATRPGPARQDGLWTVSGAPPTVIRLAPDQLGTTGQVTPSTAVFTANAELTVSVGIAFDTSGELWISSLSDSVLVAFAPDALPGSGAAAARTVIRSNNGSLSAPTGIAFDPAHRLWVANSANGTLVRFDAAELAASGAPTPAVVLTGLGHPIGVAFDAGGALWVSDNTAQTVAEYLPAQLAASGAPVPTVVLSARNRSLVRPTGLAFDREGNLWVANSGSQAVASFTPAQLAASGAPAPHVVVFLASTSLGVPFGIAFDGAGSLWVMGEIGILEQFSPADLAVTGAPDPAVRLELTGYTLFSGLAFSPVPTGLPLN